MKITGGFGTANPALRDGSLNNRRDGVMAHRGQATVGCSLCGCLCLDGIGLGSYRPVAGTEESGRTQGRGRISSERRPAYAVERRNTSDDW